MGRKFFLLVLAGFLAGAGCSVRTRQATSDAVNATTGISAARAKIDQADPQLAEIECVALCQSALTQGTDLSAGPCLGNPIPRLATWVCDVAHQPRQAVDNRQDNQCPAFREGVAKHFVEVDENCQVIATY